MKNSVSYIITSLFTVFLVVLIVMVINCFSIINKANTYHQTCIAEIQASNYSSSVISKYQGDTGTYNTIITDKTVVSEDVNLEKTGRIYEVVTEYELKIPILNYSSARLIRGYAR